MTPAPEWIERRKGEALAVLDERGEATVDEIAEASGVSRTTANLWVSSLFKEGTIQRTRQPLPAHHLHALWSRRGETPVRGNTVVLWTDTARGYHAEPRQQCYSCPYTHVVPDIEECRYRSNVADCCDLDAANRGPMTLEEVGDRLGVTRERVRQIERVALAKLRVACDENPAVFRELMDAIEERSDRQAAVDASNIFLMGEVAQGRKHAEKKPEVGVDERGKNDRERLLKQRKVKAALRAIENSDNGLTADEIADSVGMSVSWAYSMVIYPFAADVGKAKGASGWPTRIWKLKEEL